MRPKESERGMAFTEEDATCLRIEFQDILDLREDKEIDAWAAWAQRVSYIVMNVSAFIVM